MGITDISLVSYILGNSDISKMVFLELDLSPTTQESRLLGSYGCVARVEKQTWE